MRTLVISDLHLGARLQQSVLSRPAALDRLLGAVEDVDRLVLLGDVVELLEGRASRALEAAEPVLRVLGTKLGPERHVVIVPGNHDHALVGGWVRTRSGQLSLDCIVPIEASPSLARVGSWLAPARVTVRYPGAWLSERLWATHGHYLDRHLLPESAFGIARGLLGEVPRQGASPRDYELAGGPSLTRLEALLTRNLPRALATLVEDLTEFARAATMPGVPRRLLHRRMARLTALLLGVQMRRASIPAILRVVRNLGIEAEWVLFGHVHRLGPLPGDRIQQWRADTGSPKIANTGSWLYEPLLVHNVVPPHPYWPGGCVVLEEGEDPQAIGLLDDLDARSLH